MGSDDAHRQITTATACCTATARFGMDGNVKVTTAAYWTLPQPRRPFRAVRRPSGAAVSHCSGTKPDRKIWVAVTRWERRPLCATSCAATCDPTEMFDRLPVSLSAYGCALPALRAEPADGGVEILP